jgi:hypothetical protein
MRDVLSVTELVAAARCAAAWLWRAAGRHVVAICLFFVIAASTILSELDKLLKAMHPVGRAAYGVSGLSPFLGGPSPQDVVTNSWQAWAMTAGQPGSHPPNPIWIVDWYAGIDSLALVPFYSLLMFVLLRRASVFYSDKRDDAIGTSSNRAVYRRCINVALALVPAVWAVDWSENFCQAWVANGHFGFFSYAASTLTHLKYFLFIVILFVIAAAWIGVAWLRRGQLYTRPQGSSIHPRALDPATSQPPASDWRPDWVKELVLCRVHVAIVVAFVALLIGPGPIAGQSIDVMRWMADHYARIAVPIALLTLFTAVLGIGCRRTLKNRQQKWNISSSVSVSRVVLGLSVALLVPLLLLNVLAHVPIPIGLVVPPGIAAVVAALSWFAIGAQTEDASQLGKATFVSRLVVATPFIAFGVAAIRAATGDVFYSGGARPLLLLVAVGVPFLAAGGVTYGILEWVDRSADTPQAHGQWFSRWGAKIFFWPGFAAAVLFVIGAWFSPWRTARWSDGAISVTVEAMIVAAYAGFAITVLAERIPVPPVFALLRLRRLPVLTLLVIWFVVASAIDHPGTHPVRILDNRGNVPYPYTLGSAFKSWSSEPKAGLVTVDSGKDCGTSTSPAGGKHKLPCKIRPLVLVSAVGGGVRAAYWTALVLNCLVDAPSSCGGKGRSPVDPRSIFAASGASGGSLGLVDYTTRQEHPTDVGKDWVRQTLGGDFLGPTFARMFLVDAPNAFVRATFWDDRAATLEKAWERPWKHPASDLGEGLYQRGKRFPILLLNGTSVVDGCRFETSVLSVAAGDLLASGSAPSTGPVDDCRSTASVDPLTGASTGSQRNPWVLSATKDILDYLCPGQDVRLSTAALLSARFPYISPSGKIGCANYHNDPAYVVDGGYYDNTAVSPLIELWTRLRTLVAAWNRDHTDACIVPFLVEIDNHYAQPAAPVAGARPHELTIPLTTLGTVRDAHEANSSVEAALSLSPRDVAFIYPRSHPGTEAPLGWTLSSTSRTDLEQQLSNPGVANELKKAWKFFKPGRTCALAPR